MPSTDCDVPAWAVQVLACPSCGAALKPTGSGICCTDGHRFNAVHGVLQLAEKDRGDRYDDPAMPARYGQYAFGYAARRVGLPYGQGTSEGLYRTVSDLVGRELRSSAAKDPMVVDLACGVGRTVCDSVDGSDAVHVVGMDLAPGMAHFAASVCRGDAVRLGCPSEGWPLIDHREPARPRAFIFQADARQPPLRPHCADIVIANMLVDRLWEPADVSIVARNMRRLARRQGLAVMTTPSNWISVSTWESIKPGRTWVPRILSEAGLDVEIAFDELVYREALDPNGARLELLVFVATARR